MAIDILCVILALLNLVLLILYVLRWRQIDSIRRQLHFLRTEAHSNRTIRSLFPSQGIVALITELNAFIQDGRAQKLSLEHRKQGLQMQISAISHDMRTPLTSILGYLELAADSDGSAERQRYLDIAKRRAAILQKLLDDFYDLSRLEERNVSFEMLPVHSDNLLENTVLTFYDDFSNKSIDLKLDIARVPEILSNESALIRVYVNLLQNMLRYGEHEAWIRHGVVDGAVHTVFSNRFAEENPPDPQLIFERFYTGDSSRPQGATGLGLYIARLLCEQMGGKINACVRSGCLEITLRFPLPKV